MPLTLLFHYFLRQEKNLFYIFKGTNHPAFLEKVGKMLLFLAPFLLKNILLNLAAQGPRSLPFLGGYWARNHADRLG